MAELILRLCFAQVILPALVNCILPESVHKDVDVVPAHVSESKVRKLTRREPWQTSGTFKKARERGAAAAGSVDLGIIGRASFHNPAARANHSKPEKAALLATHAINIKACTGFEEYLGTTQTGKWCSSDTADVSKCTIENNKCKNSGCANGETLNTGFTTAFGIAAADGKWFTEHTSCADIAYCAKKIDGDCYSEAPTAVNACVGGFDTYLGTTTTGQWCGSDIEDVSKCTIEANKCKSAGCANGETLNTGFTEALGVQAADGDWFSYVACSKEITDCIKKTDGDCYRDPPPSAAAPLDGDLGGTPCKGFQEANGIAVDEGAWCCNDCDCSDLKDCIMEAGDNPQKCIKECTGDQKPCTGFDKYFEVPAPDGDWCCKDCNCLDISGCTEDEAGMCISECPANPNEAGGDTGNATEASNATEEEETTEEASDNTMLYVGAGGVVVIIIIIVIVVFSSKGGAASATPGTEETEEAGENGEAAEEEAVVAEEEAPAEEEDHIVITETAEEAPAQEEGVPPPPA